MPPTTRTFILSLSSSQLLGEFAVFSVALVKCDTQSLPPNANPAPSANLIRMRGPGLASTKHAGKFHIRHASITQLKSLFIMHTGGICSCCQKGRGKRRHSRRRRRRRHNGKTLSNVLESKLKCLFQHSFDAGDRRIGFHVRCVMWQRSRERHYDVARYQQKASKSAACLISWNPVPSER